MNRIIINILVLIVVFILLIIFDRKEHFQQIVGNSQMPDENNPGVGPFSAISLNDRDTEKGYEPNRLGPLCLATCVQEHGANLLFTNPEGGNDLFKWNRENPTKGYCYRANSNEFPFQCDSNCQSICGKDLNIPDENGGEYDPNLDFTQCEFPKDSSDYGDVEINECVESKLNFASGASCRNITGCRECVQKYWNNISNIFNIHVNELDNKCPTDGE